jgi:hypothetical protein
MENERKGGRGAAEGSLEENTDTGTVYKPVSNLAKARFRTGVGFRGFRPAFTFYTRLGEAVFSLLFVLDSR